MKISLHEFEYQIQIFVVFGPNYLMKFDYVGVIKLLQQTYLSKGPLSVSGVLKGIEYFFES